MSNTGIAHSRTNLIFEIRNISIFGVLSLPSASFEHCNLLSALKASKVR